MTRKLQTRTCPACGRAVRETEWVRLSSRVYHPQCHPLKRFDGTYPVGNRVWKYVEPLPGTKT